MIDTRRSLLGVQNSCLYLTLLGIITILRINYDFMNIVHLYIYFELIRPCTKNTLINVDISIPVTFKERYLK